MRSSSSGSPKCMKRPPLQVPIAVRVGSGICSRWYGFAMDRRLGVLAFGDSITNGGGELQWGVALQSWALWTARGLGLPYTGCAADGATAHDVVARQIPVFVDTAADPEARYDVGLLHIGVNDVRTPAWDAAAYERDLARGGAASSGSAAPATLVCTIPLDLGRPRALPERIAAANAAIERLEGVLRLRPAGLRRAQPGDGRRRASDGVRAGRDRGARAGGAGRATGWRPACSRPRSSTGRRRAGSGCAATRPTRTGRPSRRRGTRTGAPGRAAPDSAARHRAPGWPRPAATPGS